MNSLNSSSTLDNGVALSPRMSSFLAQLDAMCQLIEEATQYGTTVKSEADYLTIRKSLTIGYRVASEELGGMALTLEGFHGCGFEMILGHYSLDTLCRAAPRRTVAMLREVRSALVSACRLTV